jgi:hypothetical protein
MKKIMNVTTYLKKQFSNLNSVIHYYTDDLTQDEWLTRPGPDQNRIGYTVWHIARAQDHFLHAWIRGTNEIVHSERWAEWHALRPLGMGVGITLASPTKSPPPSNWQMYCLCRRGTSGTDCMANRDRRRVTWIVLNAQEYLAAFPEYQTPSYLEEINNLFGLPVWGLLIRPSMGHIHRHCGELEITKDILRKARVDLA